MVSDPGAKESKHLARAAAIYSAVSTEQSAKGRRINGKGQEGSWGKK